MHMLLLSIVYESVAILSFVLDRITVNFLIARKTLARAQLVVLEAHNVLVTTLVLPIRASIEKEKDIRRDNIKKDNIKESTLEKINPRSTNKTKQPSIEIR